MTESGIGDMVIDVDHPRAFLDPGGDGPHALQVPAIQYDHRVVIKRRGRLALDLADPRQKPVYGRDRALIVHDDLPATRLQGQPHGQKCSQGVTVGIDVSGQEDRPAILQMGYEALHSPRRAF